MLSYVIIYDWLDCQMRVATLVGCCATRGGSIREGESQDTLTRYFTRKGQGGAPLGGNAVGGTSGVGLARAGGSVGALVLGVRILD